MVLKQSLIRFFISVVFCQLIFLPFQLQASTLIKRQVLAFYDKAASQNDPFFSPTHKYAEVVLNHLGLEVIYRDINQQLPSDAEMKPMRGVLSWFTAPQAVTQHKRYCEWLTRQMNQGRYVVLLGELGFVKKQTSQVSKQCQQALNQLGVKYKPNTSDNAFFMEIVDKDSSMVEFERPLKLHENLFYQHFETLDPEAQVYLKIKRRDFSPSLSNLVVTTPQGGLVAKSFAVYQNEFLGRSHWRINPFRFFEQAFHLTGLPRPDTNMVNGRRLFYAHIDGDGIFNISHIDRKSFSGEVINQTVLQKYSHIPNTVSIITGYLDMPEYQGERAQKLYYDLFSQPHIEPASHGYAHPLKWKKKTLALNLPGYQYDPTQEVVGSLGQVNDLLRDLKINKKANLMLWTGDCLLPEEVIEIPNQHGFFNMNGGDSRFDRRFDSYTHLRPLGILKNGFRQVYSSFGNENIYTNLWKGPYYGFQELIDTIDNTLKPRLMKPINIYYHFYSGERLAALKALQKLYDYSLAQEIYPIFAGQYYQIVDSFFKLKMYNDGAGFKIVNSGNLKTIRFDHEFKWVDLKRSKGVIGFRHFQGSLYVFLSEADDHTLFLTSDRPRQPYVEKANTEILKFKARPGKIHFVKQGWPDQKIQLAGLQAQRTYLVQLEGEAQYRRHLSDAKGRLQLNFMGDKGGYSQQKVVIKLQH